MPVVWLVRQAVPERAVILLFCHPLTVLRNGYRGRIISRGKGSRTMKLTTHVKTSPCSILLSTIYEWISLIHHPICNNKCKNLLRSSFLKRLQSHGTLRPIGHHHVLPRLCVGTTMLPLCWFMFFFSGCSPIYGLVYPMVMGHWASVLRMCCYRLSEAELRFLFGPCFVK
jgi:hypothetical protein